MDSGPIPLLTLHRERHDCAPRPLERTPRRCGNDLDTSVALLRGHDWIVGFCLSHDRRSAAPTLRATVTPGLQLARLQWFADQKMAHLTDTRYAGP
jgi:hypothetical protein